MKHKYSALQINAFLTLTATAECACPARVCGAIVDMRELYDYQLGCLATSGDDKVHAAIAKASEQAHAILEDCLTDILEIEGIDPNMAPISNLTKE